ncbi:protease inhibitor I42 family protein [Dyadobacter subterraneus]|uniref:Protease inhibitor I42 family protein n=1 Tax=Dyadobacter subterraneus TaxID=2773304 RepID=A0ABR9WM38_9BACT|nr:protease inhibitor I42 family protein [Dyadobacter subterraneus]MBE9466465.1 protease inhibitor I42 family protein [Dyadobacter subterraneus]
MKKFMWISVILVVLVNMRCATSKSKRKVVILEKSETTVALRNGSSLTVKIPLQAGTGYDWTLDKGKSQIEEISSYTEKSQKENLPGRKRMKIFTLRTTKAMGEDLLKFNLSRSFEKGPAAETRILNVIIEP